MTAVRSAAGTTITFATSAFSASVTGLSFRLNREANECTAFDTVESTEFSDVFFREFDPGDIVEIEDIECEINYNADTTPPINGAKETITIQLRPKSGQSSGASLAFSGFIISYGADMEFQGKMTGSYTIKVSGQLTHTAGA